MRGIKVRRANQTRQTRRGSGGGGGGGDGEGGGVIGGEGRITDKWEMKITNELQWKKCVLGWEHAGNNKLHLSRKTTHELLWVFLTFVVAVFVVVFVCLFVSSISIDSANACSPFQYNTHVGLGVPVALHISTIVALGR